MCKGNPLARRKRATWNQDRSEFNFLKMSKIIDKTGADILVPLGQARKYHCCKEG